MPSFSGALGHRNQTVGLSLALLTVPWYTGNWKDLIVPAGCLLGLSISPDLDLIDPRGLIGKALMWVGFSQPYKEAVPHRHKVSHYPFIGTLIRALVLLGVPILCLWAIFWVFYRPFPWWSVARMLMGLCMADTLHFIADIVNTGFKKTFGQIRPKRRTHRWPRTRGRF